MSFEYFYGGQSEAFSFYRIPRRLVTGSEFRHLSTEAKLLYGLLSFRCHQRTSPFPVSLIRGSITVISRSPRNTPRIPMVAYSRTMP